MEGTLQQAKMCRFCRVRSFSRSHFQGPCGFPDFRLLGPPKWREPHKSPKFVDFVESASFPEAISKAPVDFLDFRLLGPAFMEGTPQKPKTCRFCRVRSFSGSHFQGPYGFPGFPPEIKGTSAPFPQAISKAPVDFLDFRLLGPPKWRELHKSPKFVDFVESAPFRKPFPRPLWIS